MTDLRTPLDAARAEGDGAVLIVIILFRKHLVKGIGAGAVKG